MESSSQTKPCVVCSEAIIGDRYATNRCGHSFHLSCIKGYLERKLKMGRISYKCPAIKCTICLEFKQEIMDLFDEENTIKLNAFDFCHSKVRKGKRAMWCSHCRLVYIKDSSDDAVCSYCKNPSYAITEVLLSSNKQPTVVGTHKLEVNLTVFNMMIKDLRKQVSKCDSCYEWTHPISNNQVRKCRCELRIYSKHHQKLIEK